MVAGALASVVAVGGSFQLGVLPYPSWAPAVTMAAAAPSALADRPTSGSLAGDAAWLSAFREYVASDRWDESGGESWAVDNPDDVKVLFAGDVGDARVAAIEAPYRWGLIEDRQQVWFVGDAGAAPNELNQTSNGAPSDVMVTSWGPGYEVAPEEGETACMLALVPDYTKVTLHGTPQYAADGTVTRPTWPVRHQGTARLYCDLVRDVGLMSMSFEGAVVPVEHTIGGAMFDAPAPPPLRGVRLSDQAVASEFTGLYQEAGLPASGAEPMVLWAGGPEGRRAGVLALRVPSGALIVVAVREDASVESPLTWLARDTRVVLPKQDVDEVALAWQQGEIVRTTPPPGSDQVGDGMAHAADTIGVLGPSKATTVDVLAHDGSLITTAELSEGGAVVDAPGATQVRFRDAAGTVVGQTDVIPWDEKSFDKPLWDR
jgi:hypothetical protein